MMRSVYYAVVGLMSMVPGWYLGEDWSKGLEGK